MGDCDITRNLRIPYAIVVSVDFGTEDIDLYAAIEASAVLDIGGVLASADTAHADQRQGGEIDVVAFVEIGVIAWVRMVALRMPWSAKGSNATGPLGLMVAETLHTSAPYRIVSVAPAG